MDFYKRVAGCRGIAVYSLRTCSVSFGQEHNDTREGSQNTIAHCSIGRRVLLVGI